ncbi:MULTISPECIES: flagellar biosynthesis protein FliQ [Nitratiruptor]|uniref:Flagellar biosynthetic protein FliQ n=1 Tax=Nitratiruptor tergarcus DSM 16512 TaxID=1069081 RepID=A0A1W1WSW6_9BACT|nr:MULTISPECIES: flagellar biosynthesis protein FliQ [Nitratiruptor]BCD61872.1 flagellar biosynthetic protein FliQ [Nitratiruptor sp. YY08-13]BCD65807.1 flagellar biosynthetic protein FliQ [Nitratiruptor sp. YY08-26]SMC09299.1 flagellar biosynthetic protein FliQ [Nitratiruptor tergarcus DSM 16512]
MNLDQVITLIEQMLKTSLIVGGPVLLTAFGVGMLVSIFQAATQIQEMTLTFIPKIVATVIALIVFGSWMFVELTDYFRSIFESIHTLIQ